MKEELKNKLFTHMKSIENRKIFTVKHGITRHDRVISYLREIKNSNTLPISPKKEAILNELFNLVQERVKRVRVIAYVQIFCYFGIYFTFISLLFQDFIFFNYLNTFFGTIVSGVGTSIFFIGVFLSSQLKELYYEDISLLSAQIISLYSTIDYTNMPENAENLYKKFLDYFHKRLEIE